MISTFHRGLGVQGTLAGSDRASCPTMRLDELLGKVAAPRGPSLGTNWLVHPLVTLYPSGLVPGFFQEECFKITF